MYRLGINSINIIRRLEIPNIQRKNPGKTCLVIDIGRVEYDRCWNLQKKLAAARQNGDISDVLLLVEHEPVITIGRNGSEKNLLVSESFLSQQGVSIKFVDRGGDITFHGPGQLVGYPILHLENYKPDVIWYVRQLEKVLMRTLSDFNIKAHTKKGFTGVWVGEEKIAAIGVKVSRWVTTHGFALNISTNLTYFDWIIPCGIRNKKVTSMVNNVAKSTFAQDVKRSVINHFGSVFGIKMMPYNHASWPEINQLLVDALGVELFEKI